MIGKYARFWYEDNNYVVGKIIDKYIGTTKIRNDVASGIGGRMTVDQFIPCDYYIVKVITPFYYSASIDDTKTFNSSCANGSILHIKCSNLRNVFKQQKMEESQ